MEEKKKVKRKRVKVCYTIQGKLRDAVVQDSLLTGWPASRVVDLIFEQYYQKEDDMRKELVGCGDALLLFEVKKTGEKSVEELFNALVNTCREYDFAIERFDLSRSSCNDQYQLVSACDSSIEAKK